MEKVTITIELIAEEMDKDKMLLMADQAAHMIISGREAFIDGNYDEESMETLKDIVEEGNWYFTVREKDIID